MLTSFTDRRRRVWNVGDNAVVRLFEPTPRLFPCYVNVIAHGGGSADVYSAAEFERIEPAPSIDVSRDRYDAADFANTQRDAAKEIGRALSLPAAVVEEAGKGPA